MSGSGARQSEDDDRLSDLLIVNLRMAFEQIMNSQAINRVPHTVVKKTEAPQSRALLILVDLRRH